MHVKYSSYHASVLYCEIPSSNFEVKMERTKFYETLYQKALEFANNKELIRQTVPPKRVSNQIEYQAFLLSFVQKTQ